MDNVKNDVIQIGDLRFWFISPVTGKIFSRQVNKPSDAIIILHTLLEYDKINNDVTELAGICSHTFELKIYDPNCDGNNKNGFVEYYTSDNLDLRELIGITRNLYSYESDVILENIDNDYVVQVKKLEKICRDIKN